MKAYIAGGNPDFTSVPININTGVQTITINGLTVDQPYSIYITATDSSAASVTITSDPQDFTTAAGPLVAAVIQLDPDPPSEQNRNNNQLGFSISAAASGGSGSRTDEWQYKKSSVGSWPEFPDTFVDNLLTVDYGTSYDVRVKTTDTTSSTVYSNTVTATLYATLTIGDASVYPPGQQVNIGQVVTISIATGNLFYGGIGPYSFDVSGLDDFTIDMSASSISSNNVGITNTTRSFSQSQTTYLISGTKTLVYKWTSSGSPPDNYSFSLYMYSGDGQYYNTGSSGPPFTFTLVDLQ
jgi:hypothetical protein